ncbi:hypothetical protein Mal35_11070 [Gimesia maris]|uniref:DUF4175 family protein n=1 Tax=Gimesia maris TaxID=122 RepID=UPI001187B997|nr:DUF4175 family protein [Gimesia maris]QDT77679.1 hypothetical protein Mal35_11070 [Gimesia maris]
MDGQLDQFVNELKRQLNQLDRRIRSLALLRGLGLVILVLICLITLQISIDFLFSLDSTARIIMSSLSLAVVTGCLWFGILRRVIRKRTPVELAAIVEESQSSLNERLTSVLELASAQNETSSVMMRERLARETIASLTNFNITDSVPSDRAMRFIMSAGIAILIFITPLLFWPDAYRLLLSRSVIPWGNFATVSSLYFEVQPGDETVARGTDLKIVAEPHWHTKEPGQINDVWIEWKDSAGKANSRRMDLDQETGFYLTQFPRLLSGFQYTISSDRSRSKQYTIHIAEPPSITETLLTVNSPGYTQKPAEQLTVIPSELRVIEQSLLEFKLKFDRPVTAVTLESQRYTSGTEERHPVEQKAFSISEDQLSAELSLPVHKNSFLYHLKLESLEGKLTTQSSEHLVKVIPDRAPEIELSLYNQPEFIKPTDGLTVPVKVMDDFSVAELEIHVQKLDEKATVIQVPASQLGTRSVNYEFKIDLEGLRAQQSDIFTYRVRAADNREIPEPNVVWTTPRVFGIDKNADQQLSAGVVARQEKLRGELQKIQQEYKEHKNQVDQKIAELNQVKEKEALKAADQEQLQELSNQERKLAQKLENLANEFLQLPLYQKLAQQTQEVARTDFVKNHDTLKSTADAENVKQARNDLKPVPKAMKGTEQKLDQLARQYDKLVELENDLLNLNRLAEDTNHLADDLLAFNDKLESTKPQSEQQAPRPQENPDGKQPATEKPEMERKKEEAHQQRSPEMEKELADLQAELKHRQSRLTKDLDQLLERRPELVDAARNYQMKQLDSLVRQTSQLVEPQTQLAETIQEQAPVAAGRPAAPQTAEPPAEADQPATAPGENQSADNNTPPAATPAGQAPPAAAESSQNAATTAVDGKPATAAQAAESKMSNEPARARAEPAKEESVRDLQRQQQMLAEAATNFVLETAQQFGPDSEPTRRATQLAEESIKAQQAADAGRLHEASQAANRASKKADEIMQAHQEQNKENTERDAFLEQAERMANLQQSQAEKMEQASTSESKRQEALQNTQQALARQTQALSKELSETSRKLETDPIGLKKESQQADRTRKKTETAGQAMEKAVDGLQDENLAQAAEQAQQAAQALQEAARQAQQASRQKAKESPVPEKVGNQVTDAAQQLREAQKQLEQSPEFKNQSDQSMAQQQQSPPGDAKENSQQSSPADQKEKATESGDAKAQANSEAGDKSQSQEQMAENDNSQQGDSEQQGKPSKSREAAESLKRAAESLSQAATELKSKAQQGSDPGKGQQSQTASKNMAQGKGQGESEGGGAQTNVDFSELKIKLQAMSDRNWGELPGQLDTEILQGSRTRTDPEYARLIKHYFEAISKSKPESN